MDSFSTLFRTCYRLLDTELTFAPYTFTIWQYFLAIFVLGVIIDIVVWALRR